MTQNRDASPQGTATLRSYVDRTHHAVVAEGQFAELFTKGFLDHARTLGPLPDELALELMLRALAAGTLRLALLPPDQFCSWTYNIVDPQLNIFVTGDNSDFHVTGRIYSENVQALDVNRLFIETARPQLKPARSVVDFEGLDIIGALHQYYERSLQMRARMLALEDNRIVLIEGLPMVDREWLAQLDKEAIVNLLNSGELEKIEDRVYRFFCGCDKRRINSAMWDMFAGSMDELFGDDEKVEVQCPRCGRYWTLSRADLELGDA